MIELIPLISLGLFLVHLFFLMTRQSRLELSIIFMITQLILLSFSNGIIGLATYIYQTNLPVEVIFLMTAQSILSTLITIQFFFVIIDAIYFITKKSKEVSESISASWSNRPSR
jgi:hypothetical protein